MSAWWWCLVVVLVLLVAAYLDLFVIRRGLRFVGPDGFTFWVRQGSWLNRITRADGTTVHRTLHEAPWHVTATPTWCAHEYRHAWQQLRDPRPAPAWTADYLTDHEFRERVERDAIQFGREHAQDPYFVGLAAKLTRSRQ